MKTATHKPESQNGFLFLANELVLDFLNTRPILEGRPVELLSDFNSLLRWFRAANLLNLKEIRELRGRWSGRRLNRLTQTMRDWRESLRVCVLTWEASGAIKGTTTRELNRLLAKYPMRRRLIARGRVVSVQDWFELREPVDLFAPLAYSALKLFTEVDRSRVRKCPQCVLHFHDTSKKGTRRWCSMQLCGNRSKVAAYAARRRRHKLK